MNAYEQACHKVESMLFEYFGSGVYSAEQLDDEIWLLSIEPCYSRRLSRGITSDLESMGFEVVETRHIDGAMFSASVIVTV